jgi:putative glutamine amidotransferase
VKRRPVVGLTLDAEAAGGWSAFPWYALRANYLEAVAAAGGLPVALGHDAALAEDMLGSLDALIVTGGAFDVDPALYGGGERHPTVALKGGRTAAELTLTRGAVSRGMPLLGICGGMQLLAVAFGGTLIQHIPDEHPDALAHEQTGPRDRAGHEVAVEEGSALLALTGRRVMAVNSSHHQAVRDAGSLVVSARAADGIVEAVETRGMREGGAFCLGVQWHPEFLIDPGDGAIFAGLVEAARAR